MLKDSLNKFPKILSQAAILLLFTVVLLSIYSPVFHGHYFNGEDYGAVWTSPWSVYDKASFTTFTHEFPFEGRPLHNLFLYTIFIKYVNTLKSVGAGNTVRFAAVIGVTFFAYVLYLIFKENGFKAAHSFLMSILICTLPPVQIYVCRIVLNAYLYAALLAAISALILFKTAFKEDRRSTARTVIAILTAITLMVITLNIYQPAAMTYWAVLLIPLIIMKDKDFIKRWLSPLAVYFSVGIVSIILYFVSTKITFALLNNQANALTTRGGFIKINQVFPKMIAFIKYPFYTTLNLWDTFPSRAVGLSVAFVIIAGFLYSLIHVVLLKVKENKSLSLLTRHLIILIIIPLSYMTHILIMEDSEMMIPKFRTLAGLEITVFLLFFWGVINIAEFLKSSLKFSAHLQEKIITIALIILTVTAAFAANHNVDKFVKLHSGELRYVKNVIKEYGESKLSKDSKIYLISSDREATKYFSEFFYLSSNYRLSIYMVRLALYEVGVNTDIPVNFIDYNEEPDTQLPTDRNILIVDMRDFQKKAYKELNIPLTIQPLF